MDYVTITNQPLTHQDEETSSLFLSAIPFVTLITVIFPSDFHPVFAHGSTRRRINIESNFRKKRVSPLKITGDVKNFTKKKNSSNNLIIVCGGDGSNYLLNHKIHNHCVQHNVHPKIDVAYLRFGSSKKNMMESCYQHFYSCGKNGRFK